MKRSEIIGLLNETGQLMDVFERVETKDEETGEVIGTISKDAIHGMQVAMLCCTRLLDGTKPVRNPMALANRMIGLYTIADLHLDEDGYKGTEYHVSDGDDAND